MRLHKVLPIVTAAAATCAFAVQPSDIVFTPPSGGGMSVTNAAGDVTRFRVDEDGSVTLPGAIYKGTSPFLHNSGTSNTYVGVSAGNVAMTGTHNVGMGTDALLANTNGNYNTAVGSAALVEDTGGSSNTALGSFALHLHATGNGNTAVGAFTMYSSTTAQNNTALGNTTLYSNTTGDSNVAIGQQALSNNLTGSGNIAVGVNAGGVIQSGGNNIHIGNQGTAASEASTTRIGSTQTRAFIAGIRGTTTAIANAVPVLIDNLGQLGTASSSRRFKDDIADMDSATDALMQLRPVTFHYKSDQDPAGRTLQYGLIAEEVAEVYPGLVAYSADGEIETVMYQFLPSMLLNQVQKQQRTIEAQAAELRELRALRGEVAAIRQQLERREQR